MPAAVLSAIGLRETVLTAREEAPVQDDPVLQLVEHFKRRPALLVLDNCEHVIGAAADLAQTLLTRCPGLRVLATSREPLGVPGESVRPIEPLPPDPAHRLFVERARAVLPGLDSGTAPAREAIAEICRRLDGLPLAIELAAARLRHLTLRQIADRLDDRFRLLTSGSRTVLPRQQTLRAVVDWSWELLDADERRALAALSVFAGGCDLAAAEAVTGSFALDHLSSLVDKSLLVAAPAPDGTGMRYRMLETIHEYAAERAAEDPAARAAAERAHAEHFTALAETADPLLRSERQLPWIQRLETDLDNIRAALHRAVEGRDEPLATRIALAMGWFWWLRNYRLEGDAWLARVVALGPDPELPPGFDDTTRFGAGSTARAPGEPRGPGGGVPDPGETDPRFWPRMRLRMVQFHLMMETAPNHDMKNPESQALIARVFTVFARPGRHSATFPGLLWPFAAFVSGVPGVVKAYLDASVDNCREYGGDWELCTSLMLRAHVGVDTPGGLFQVDRDLAELAELSGRVGDRWMRAQVASAIAEAAMTRGHSQEARAAYEEGLRLALEIGAHGERTSLKARLAEVDFRAGDLESAERLLEETAVDAEQYGVQDMHSFTRFLRAAIAHERGDSAKARQLVQEARRDLALGTPPAHFVVMLDGLEGAVVAATGEPKEGARRITRALRDAHVHNCAEIFTAHLAENAAAVLTVLGEHRVAVRLLAAADSWRVTGDCPRFAMEENRVRATEAGLRERLSTEEYEEERAKGARLTVQEVDSLLSAVLGLDDE